MPQFNDIPQLPKAHYEIDVDWTHIEKALKGYVEDYGLDLNPDFQRAHVWTTPQQTAYVEWILRGGETGRVLFFNCPGWDHVVTGVMTLVDGKQRLEAVRAFMRDELPAFGRLKSEYTDRLRVILVSFKFRIAALATRRDILEWYLAINSGGTPHTPEELKRVQNLLKESV
jgi:hypothetical protein